MEKKTLKQTILNIAQKSADELGYEVVDIEYQKGSKHDLLTIFIYKDSGIDVDDCTLMSRSVEEHLDKLNLIENPYYLEISSPGLDRPIKTQSDYKRNLGKEVEIKLFAPMDGKKKYEAVLEDFNTDSVFVKVNEEKIEIPIKAISLMRLLIKF